MVIHLVGGMELTILMGQAGYLETPIQLIFGIMENILISLITI